MDNKELPQEIQDKIENKASERYPNPKEVAELLMKDCFIDDMEEGAEVASEYYEPKLAEKDAKIKEQSEQIDKLKGLLKDIDKSLYIGEDLKDNEIMDFYIQVAGTIKETIKQHGM